MKGLHARAGQEALFISVRTDRDHYAKPFFLASSSKVEDHFKKTTGMMPGNYAANIVKSVKRWGPLGNAGALRGRLPERDKPELSGCS